MYVHTYCTQVAIIWSASHIRVNLILSTETIANFVCYQLYGIYSSVSEYEKVLFIDIIFKLLG